MPRHISFGVILTGTGGPGHHDTWLDPEIPGDASVDIDWYIEQAQAGRGGRFDLVFIVDSQFITPDSPPHYLNRLEPLTLLVRARDAHRAIGWSARDDLVQLAVQPRAAVRVARPDQPRPRRLERGHERRLRYRGQLRPRRALRLRHPLRPRAEHIEVSQALWDSYEDDAFPRDRAPAVPRPRASSTRSDHRGEHFSVVGPLNIERSPQGQPVIFQAGDSDEGRDLGAAYADGIFTHASSYRAGQGVRRRHQGPRAAVGRNPEHMLILPGRAHHRRRHRRGGPRDRARQHRLANTFERALAELGRPSAGTTSASTTSTRPFPDVLDLRRAQLQARRRRRSSSSRRSQDLTLRQIVETLSAPRRSPFAGSARDRRRRDRGVVHAPAPSTASTSTSSYPAQFAAVHRRGAADPARARRRPHRTTRARLCASNLGLPIPANRHTAARASRRADRAAARHHLPADPHRPHHHPY